LEQSLSIWRRKMEKDPYNRVPCAAAQFMVEQIADDRPHALAHPAIPRELPCLREADSRLVEGDDVKAMLRKKYGVPSLPLRDAQYASAWPEPVNHGAQEVVRLGAENVARLARVAGIPEGGMHAW
jgi:hypothetical protein